jgi:hypothetical protein
MESRVKFENNLDDLNQIMGQYNLMLERVNENISQNSMIYSEKAQDTLKEVRKLTKNIEKDNLLIYNKILEQNNKIKSIDRVTEFNENIEKIRGELNFIETTIENGVENIEGNILNYQYRTELMIQQIYTNQMKIKGIYKKLEILCVIIIILIMLLILLIKI